MESSTYDALVADFYRAATGVLSWEQALESVREVFRARCAPLQTMDLRSGTVISAHYGGPDMHRPALDYIREYHSIDPRAKLVLSAPAGTWVSCHDHLDEDFAANDRFFQEFLASFDSRYVSGMVIPVDAHTVAIWGIQLSAGRGPLDQEDREWARRLGEHLREALLAYERVRKLAAQALAGHSLLASFPYPMWLIDAERFVFYSNAEAARELEQGQRLGLRGPRLGLLNNRADQALSLQIAILHQSGHGARGVVDLRRTQSDPPTWLHLSLLVPGQVLGAFGERPQILATLFDPQQISTLDPFALSSIFSFTPTEARVATLLAEGLTMEEIALRHGTRKSTVRSQMSQVFAKLGVARQADVVRVLRQGEALWARAGV